MSEQFALTFDYGALDDDARTIVVAARDRIKVLERKTGEAIIEIGRQLVAVKATLPHGQFLPWIDAEFGWSARTAQRFMSVAETFGEMRHGVAFEAKALYALASGDVPDDIRQDLIARAEAGETIRHQDVKAAIAETVTPERDPPPLFAVVDLETGEVVRLAGEPDDFDVGGPAPTAPASQRPTSIRPEPSDDTLEFVKSLPDETVQSWIEGTREAGKPHWVREQLADCVAKLYAANRVIKTVAPNDLHSRRHEPDIREMLEDIALLGSGLFLLAKSACDEEAPTTLRRVQ